MMITTMMTTMMMGLRRMQELVRLVMGEEVVVVVKICWSRLGRRQILRIRGRRSLWIRRSRIRK
jgi:hypothetical protein